MWVEPEHRQLFFFAVRPAWAAKLGARSGSRRQSTKLYKKQRSLRVLPLSFRLFSFFSDLQSSLAANSFCFLLHVNFY